MAEKIGLFGKYLLAKSNGEDLDPRAKYFVLRYDADSKDGRAAQFALRHYASALNVSDEQLASDLRAEIEVEAARSRAYAVLGNADGGLQNAPN